MKRVLPHLGVLGGACSVLATLVAFAFARGGAGPAALPTFTCAPNGQEPFPDPTADVSPGTFTLQTQEPSGGFTGACLQCFSKYSPTLPLGCYSPSSPTWGVQQQVTFPAAKVARSYGALPNSYDSYLTVITCYPHNMDGTCPPSSLAVSRSCCDYGMTLTSTDGQKAVGLVGFTSH